MTQPITTAKIIKSTGPITRKNAELIFDRDYMSIRYWCPDKKRNCGSFKQKQYFHYSLWRFCLRWLKKKGFLIYIDADFAKNYSCLINQHRWGFSNDLEFKTNIFPAGFNIEFYQNQKFENPNGGEYDSNKYQKMPERIRLYFEAICNELIEEFLSIHHLNFYDSSDLRFPALTAEQQLLKYEHEKSFSKFEIQCVAQTEDYMSDYDFKHNSTSGIKDLIKCGEIRRFIDYDKTIQIGTVYHHINNMWWVIKDKYTLRNIADWEILDKVPENTTPIYKTHLHLLLDRVFVEKRPIFEEFLNNCLNRCKEVKSQFDLANQNLDNQDKAVCCALNAHAIMICHLASIEQQKAKNSEEYAVLYNAKIKDEIHSSINFLKQNLPLKSETDQKKQPDIEGELWTLAHENDMAFPVGMYEFDYGDEKE